MKAECRGETCYFLYTVGSGPFSSVCAVPDHAFAAVVRKFEILGQLERVDRTSVFAQAAEHAAAQVVGKVREFFAAGLFIALAGDHDQVFGTSQCAQVAGNAERLVGVRIHVQPRRAAITFGDLRPLQRILLGIDFLGILIPEGHVQSLDQVHQKHFP